MRPRPPSRFGGDPVSTLTGANATRPFANCRAESGTVHEAAPGDPHSVDKDMLRRDPVIELDRVDSDDHVERRGDLCGLDVPRVFRFDRQSWPRVVSHPGRTGRRSRMYWPS